MAIELTIESLSHDGKGVARDKGKVCFIPGALPGETVSVNSIRSRKSYNTAALENIITPAANRVTPECQYFGRCGGCDLQHMTYASQLEFKQKHLLDTLKRVGKVEPEQIEPAITADEFGYRRRARFAVRLLPQEDRVAFGFRQADGKFVVDIDACLIVDSRINDLIKPLRALVESLSCKSQLREVVVSAGDHAVGIDLSSVAKPGLEDEAKLAAFGKIHDVRLNTQSGGDLLYTLENHQVTLQFETSDFVQVNANVNQKLVSAVYSALQLKNTDRVLDLFCGLGNFSLPTARHAEHVCGIESDESMVQRAAENARRNNIHNAEFLQRDLFDTPQLKSINKNFNVLVLDPPRAGALEAVENLVPRIKPERIAYVSCHPASMARDSAILCGRLGYELRSVCMVDMFPQTHHVETLALFVKAGI